MSGPADLSISDRSDPAEPTAALSPRAAQRVPAYRLALAGGVSALLATLLLPFHLLGGSGLPVGLAFGVSGIALAAASLAAPHGVPRAGTLRTLRNWAVLGAVGFVVAAAGLIADLLDWPLVLSEVLAVFALAAWWAVFGRETLVARASTPRAAAGGLRRLAWISIGCALIALAAVAAQLLAESGSGAVPARTAYLAWGPWGLALAARLRRAALSPATPRSS